MCADTNDLGEISAPRVRINNTLVGGILDFRIVKYIFETRRANEHEAPESVPKPQKIDSGQCNLSQDWKKCILTMIIVLFMFPTFNANNLYTSTPRIYVFNVTPSCGGNGIG